MVTLTPSSRNTRSWGRGRKSGTTFRSPSGSSLYSILSFIKILLRTDRNALYLTALVHRHGVRATAQGFAPRPHELGSKGGSELEQDRRASRLLSWPAM